ncbi:hypothetical protein NAEGRDRAFT_78542 [Naegleria gruberi]|uniref:Uncharacterized protein n=1 Tax=Naegleria gruberi TaxID=5762 RepID=D2V4H8_NAEGR|nr:uncharacterized protein NAEGRDRAFT_78542 [Naegleria gruberi]EFC48385.1 hypothetical protein NAEGRDRAFT_78542 [Naegleria gruberi]|eukprot:XP_002681129.1 hypothetical protein NAEGRDRAFT_78542 [Naegleria gruberi strain NEG-M]
MKLLSGILSKNNSSHNSRSNNTSVTGSLNSNTQSSSSSGSNYSCISGSISSNTSSSCSVLSSVASLSSSSISKTRKEQQLSSSAEYCNTSILIQSPPLSARKTSNKSQPQSNNITATTLSPTPSQSCSFSSPKKQSNNSSNKEPKDNHPPTVNQSTSINTPERSDPHHQRQASEDFLNSLSFALPQIEYEEVMKQVQQRTVMMSNQNDNITAENIDVMSSDGYDFEYYNKEEEEKKLKKKQLAASSSKKKAESKPQPSSTPSTPASNSFKSPIKSSTQPTISQTPTKSSSSSVKSKPITPAVNQSTEALTTLSTSKSRLSLKPSTIRNKIKQKDSPKQQKTSQSKSKPIISEPPKVNPNRKERKNSEKSTTSSKSGNSSIVNNAPKVKDEDVIAVIVDDDDEDMNDLEHDLSSAHELHSTEMVDEDEEEDDVDEESCNTMTSPRTPCSKKRKAFEEFEDSLASSKKKKEDSIILDSVIKKVMDISIPDTPAMEEDSPSCDSSLSISPSLSYNSQSTCGEHSEYCISPLDSIAFDAKLYSSQSNVDIKEVNQKITTLTKVIEQRNAQILQRDEYIANLSKENKEMKKFKSMIHKLDDVGFVFYMKASELVCEGLMARDLDTKESQEIIHDSLQKGIRYMRASAEFGNVDAMFEYAELILRYSKSKKHEAKEFLQKASEKGHKKAGVFLKSLEMKEETQRYEKSVEHDHLLLYGQETTKTKSKRK